MRTYLRCEYVWQTRLSKFISELPKLVHFHCTVRLVHSHMLKDALHRVRSRRLVTESQFSVFTIHPQATDEEKCRKIQVFYTYFAHFLWGKYGGKR